jgi:hypothetical protein
LPAVDFFNSTRSTSDIGASIVATSENSTSITAGTTTDPFGNVVGAGLTVQQSSPNVKQITPTSAAIFANAVNGASPGDIIELASGSYSWNAQAYIQNVNGTSANWIIVRPAPGATVTITGPGYGTLSSGGSTSGTDGIGFGANTSYISLQGINITKFRNGITTVSGSHIQIAGNNVSYMGGTGIGNYNVPSIGPMCHNLEISNNTVSYDNQLWVGSPQNTYYGWALAITAWGNNVSVFGNTVSFSNGEGIGISGQYAWVHNNVVNNFVAVGIYLQEPSQSVVENNFVWNDVAGNSAWFSSGITQSSNKVGLLMANEDASSNTGTSYTFLQQLTIRNNIVFNAGLQIAYENFKVGNPMGSVRIVNNTFVGGGTGSSSMMTFDAAAIGSHSGVVIANNICVWTQSGGSNGSLATTGITYGYQNWYNVTPGSASGTGDVTGRNPNFHG